MTPIVEMQQIVKRFSRLIANDHVSFEAQRGEIHGLLGENGAGKTTLMNILYGLYRQDSGEIFFDGQPAHIDSPKRALELGIGMVHQHFRLIPRLTVVENIVLGFTAEPPASATESAWTRWRRNIVSVFARNLDAAEAHLLELSAQYGLKIQPRAKIWELSVGEQQRVEIIKALYRNVKVLIFDEPTAVLTPQEVDSLFDMLRTMVAKGLTIIFITHKLNEVMCVCHRITVLRNGAVVATVRSVEHDKASLAKMMVGRDVVFHVNKQEQTPGKPILNVENLNVLNDKGLQAVKDVSLTIHAGEILGLAGVSGNGQRELIEAINGLRHVESGAVSIDGVNVTNAAPKQIIDCGVGYIPEDRVHVGLATSLPLPKNLLLKSQGRPEFSQGWFLNHARIKAHAEKLVADFDVRTASLDIPVGRLSGGNIQKLILARELARNPQLLIASQPTRGLDVGAIEYVQTTLLSERSRGTAILLVSENLDETLHISDRVAVMYEGRIVGILPAKNADRRQIGLMMTGGDVAAK